MCCNLPSRTGLYAQSDIAEFTPSSGDLAYPDKLEMMKEIEKEHSLDKVIVFKYISLLTLLYFLTSIFQLMFRIT